MAIALPTLSTFDPPTSSEGTLDPLGLYQIADQLATRLVPAVRERMSRIRFLTPMAVGALVTEDLEPDPEQPDCPPHLIWEWLVVESLIRRYDKEKILKGVPGTQVTRNALVDHGYLDHASYLKTPRIFGFHGVYKRLAIHLGIISVHLGIGPECEGLVEAWAKDRGYKGLRDLNAQHVFQRWRDAVKRGLSRNPCRTRPAWRSEDWHDLAESFFPNGAGRHEKRVIQRLLHSDGDRTLGALPAIWNLQDEFTDEEYCEESLHSRLKEVLPSAIVLLDAIKTYEAFCRSLQDGFDLIRALAGGKDARGFDVASIGDDADFRSSFEGLHTQYDLTRARLSEVDSSIATLFDERFSKFAEPRSSADAARVLCEHHETIQNNKSAEGKRAWFDRLSPERIYMRHRYRVPRPTIAPSLYVHDYRGQPIRNFYSDL